MTTTAVEAIPDDVMEVAGEICSLIAEYGHPAQETVARAILADRARNAPDGGEVEPVAWRVRDVECGYLFFSDEREARQEAKLSTVASEPLYVAPPAPTASPASGVTVITTGMLLDSLDHIADQLGDEGDVDSKKCICELVAEIRSALVASPEQGEVEYEIRCDGEFAASSTNLADAMHYAAVYRRDGPVEVIEVRRRKLDTLAKIGGGR